MIIPSRIQAILSRRDCRYFKDIIQYKESSLYGFTQDTKEYIMSNAFQKGVAYVMKNVFNRTYQNGHVKIGWENDVDAPLIPYDEIVSTIDETELYNFVRDVTEIRQRKNKKDEQENKASPKKKTVVEKRKVEDEQKKITNKKRAKMETSPPPPPPIMEEDEEEEDDDEDNDPPPFVISYKD